MKNKAFQIFTFAACSIFLFSCATGNKYSKKSYGGGWQESVAKNESPASSPSVETTTTVTTKSTEVVVSTSETPAIAVPTQVENTQTSTKAVTGDKKISKIKAIATVRKAIKETKSAVKSHTTAPKETNESAIGFILLFILCFIIPPLAYIIHKKQTDGWFWLDLILFLFAISYVFGFTLGLAGLASVVIALLALFDVL